MMGQIQEKLCNKRKYKRPKKEKFHLQSPSETSSESEIKIIENLGSAFLNLQLKYFSNSLYENRFNVNR